MKKFNYLIYLLLVFLLSSCGGGAKQPTQEEAVVDTISLLKSEMVLTLATGFLSQMQEVRFVPIKSLRRILIQLQPWDSILFVFLLMRCISTMRI